MPLNYLLNFKNAGFIILLTSIFTFFFFGEIRNLTTLCLLPLVNNGFSLSSFFLSLLSFLWIGAQFPQEKFLSYGRIFTLHYYFLLMCILFSSFYWLSTGFSWIYWNFIRTHSWCSYIIFYSSDKYPMERFISLRTNEISFTIISLSSSDKFFLESGFFIRNYYYITNYHRNLLRFTLYIRS
jgi:hypothetical protein